MTRWPPKRLWESPLIYKLSISKYYSHAHMHIKIVISCCSHSSSPYWSRSLPNMTPVEAFLNEKRTVDFLISYTSQIKLIRGFSNLSQSDQVRIFLIQNNCGFCPLMSSIGSVLGRDLFTATMDNRNSYSDQ